MLLDLGQEQFVDRALGPGRVRCGAAQAMHPEHLELRGRASEPVTDHRVSEAAIALCQLHQLVEVAVQPHQETDVGRASLERDRGQCDRPALAGLPEQGVTRDSDIVEEHLGELLVAVGQPYGAHGDAFGPRVDDERRDAGVPGRVGVCTRQDQVHVGEQPEARPDLLAVDDVVVTVPTGGRPDRSEVRAGVRLGKALAPDRLGAQQPGEIPELLLLGTEMKQRPAQVRTRERSGRPHASLLLVGDDLLYRPQSPSAVFGGPRERIPASVVQPLLPGAREGEPAGHVRRLNILRRVRSQPVAKSLTEAGLLG